MKKLLLTFIAGCAAIFFGTANLQAATVTTDQADYAPGSTATITGAGFQPGETVELQVLRIDIDENSGPEHVPWQVTADASGNFTTTWYVAVDEEGATLQLTATGLASGLIAQHVFTDASTVAATGGNAISADTTGGSWTSLTGPALTETSIGDLGVGTIIFNVPPGFVFDTNSPAPNVKLTVGDTSSGNKNINNLVVGTTNTLTTTPTNITFNISTKSNGQTTNILTFQNIRVRPTSGTPLASGNITNSGTATQAGGAITNNFGTLTEVAGTATKLVFTTSPVTVTAGVASGTISVQRQDQFGNPNTNNATITVNLTSSSTGGSFLNTNGVSAITSTNILIGASTASFLYKDTKAGSPTVTNSASGLTSATQTETISKATPTISGVTASQTNSYGTATIALSGTVSATGSVYPTNGEVVSVTINSITTNAVVSGGAGVFSVNFSTATIPFSASAYTITYAYAGGTNLNAAANNTSTALTVNKAALSVTANNDSKTYGQTKSYGAGLTNFTSSGLQNSETIGTVTITASGGTATNAAAGTYNLTPSAASGGTFNAANYTITYSNGTLTVNKAALSITANNDSKTYGQAKSYGAGQTTFSSSGLQNGETFASVTITASGGTATNAALGTYNLTPSAAAGGTGNTNNYTLTYTDGTLTVNKAVLTITADNKSRTYGAANPTFTYTPSGFVNGENSSVLSGSPSLTTTATTNSSVAGGPYTITAAVGTLSAANYSFSFANGQLSVTAAALNVTANNDSKTYGQTKSYGAGLTNFTSSGLQNSETIGTVTITASGGTAANATAGSYNLTPSAATGGTFNAANYTITYNNGTLTVNKASTTGTVVTTAPSVLPGNSVKFTNTLSVVAPGAGTPTGTVQFKTNGVAFGSSVTLSGLVAVSATATLPHGSNTVTAEYSGDSNFIGTTNALAPKQVVNTPPVARAVSSSVAQGSVVSINFDLGKYKLATDADADTMTIISASGATNANLGVAANGLSMTYTNTSGSAGTFDAFSFVISDGFGGLATNTATIRIESPVGFNQLSVVGNTLNYVGIPGANYAVENTAILSPATWAPVVTNAVGTDGKLSFNLGATPSGFYRTRYVSGP